MLRLPVTLLCKKEKKNTLWIWHDNPYTNLLKITKNPGFISCKCRRLKIHKFDPWVRKIPWRRAWQPTPVFLPEESPGNREAWRATVHRAAKNRTRLKWLTCMQEKSTGTEPYVFGPVLVFNDNEDLILKILQVFNLKFFSK